MAKPCSDDATACEALLKEAVFEAKKLKNIHSFKGMQMLKKSNKNEVSLFILLFDDKAAHYKIMLQLA